MIAYRLVAFGAALERVESPLPVPAGGEVVVAVRASGVCHSDLHLADGSLRIPLPRTIGHEIAGDVVAAGPDARGVEVGKRYVVYPWIGEGTCELCRAGHEELCERPRALGTFRDGGYADHVVVPDARYLLDAGDLAPERAAPLACSGLTAYAALKKIEPALARGPVLLIGAGGVGMMALAALRALGGAGAVVVEPDARKRDAAVAAGALAAIDPDAEGVADAIVAACGGKPRGAIDFVGSPQSAKLGLRALARNGTLVMVGLFGGTAPWPLSAIPLGGVTIRGSYVGTLTELGEVLALARAGRFGSVPLTTHPLAAANATLDDLKGGRIVGRAILIPEGAPA